MKKLSIIISTLLFLASSGYAKTEAEFLTVKRTIRVTDGIARGVDKEDAKQNAIENARNKARERVATSFIHSYEKVENAVLTEEKIIQDLHAEIIRTKVRKVEYPFENVCLVTVDFTIKYFDLDFFVRELRKSAESSMMRSLVLSGWGQVYNRNYFNGLCFFVTTYGSFYRAYIWDGQATDYKHAYDKAGSATVAEAYNNFKNADIQSKTWLVIGISSWAYSMWEAFEDREITNLKLDDAHKQYFPTFWYTREKSFVQKRMDNWAPKW